MPDNDTKKKSTEPANSMVATTEMSRDDMRKVLEDHGVSEDIAGTDASNDDDDVATDEGESESKSD